MKLPTPIRSAALLPVLLPLEGGWHNSMFRIHAVLFNSFWSSKAFMCVRVRSNAMADLPTIFEQRKQTRRIVLRG